MVHALEEVRRTLVPEGVLIDLRPMAGRWPVEVTSDRSRHPIGWLQDLPNELADSKAANIAIKEAARRGWFVRESKQSFRFSYYWDTPEEMREFIREEWSGFTELEENAFSTTQNAWADAGTDRRVRVQLRMHLARWRKR